MTTPGTRDLSVLFDPRSVAVIGASDDETKYGNWLGAQALRMTGSRDVHLVNRRAGTVLGHPASASLGETGDTVDLVAIAVPTHGFEASVEDALAAGARAIVGVTAGFAELGAEGHAVQERVVARVREAGAVLVGPNCLGLTDSSTGLTLSSNTMPEGRIALLSQSGNMALELSRVLAARGQGFSRFVSLGNQADLGVADLIRSCAQHDGTDVIALYCEDFGDGREFVDATREAAAAGKPVILLTVGSSEASIRGAKSHTGSLTSATAVVDAACRAGGVYRVTSPRSLADVASVLTAYGPVAVGNLVVVADGGGHASVASDLAESAGVRVPELPPGLDDELRTAVGTGGHVQNPVDVVVGPGFEIGSFASIVDTALRHPGIDGVLLSGYFGGYEHYGAGMARSEEETALAIAGSAHRYRKPVLVHSMFPDGSATGTLSDNGVPVFAAVEDATNCLGVLNRAGARRPLPALPGPADRPIRDTGYWNSRQIIRDAGIPAPDARLVGNAEDAVAAATAIGFPVALKAMGLLHKSDSGGVSLGISDEDRLVEELTRMRDTLGVSSFCVEALADLRAGIELIVGVQQDPRFGPVVMVGFGGVLAEVLVDVTFELAPVDEAVAESMLSRLRSTRLLDEFRGRPKLDTAAAARAITAVSALAVSHPEISEIEVNPLLVTPSGVSALDARIVLQE